jgi:hypothetical protein
MAFVVLLLCDQGVLAQVVSQSLLSSKVFWVVLQNLAEEQEYSRTSLM